MTLTHSFEMQTTEVTQGQFLSVMGYNPALHSGCGASCPAENMTWHQAAQYCNALSARRGLTLCYSCSTTCTEVYAQGLFYACPGYRLPTEAEWEYGYRAGSTTALYNGPLTSCTGANAGADLIGWYDANAGSVLHPAGAKAPNAWGLFDMAGNVWERVNDWGVPDLGSAPAIDPWGGSAGPFRVTRGGSFAFPVGEMRAARRNLNDPVAKDGNWGFRCVRSLNP